MAGERPSAATIWAVAPDGHRENFFSRLEMSDPPLFVVPRVGADGQRDDSQTRKSSTAAHYQRLTEADPTTFREMIDQWILEFAELYAAKN